MSRAALIAMLGCLGAGAANADSVRATGAEAPAGEDGQWSMPSKDYAATRYSGLTGITRQNAGSLHPVWTFSTGVLGGHEGQPLVVGDTMYVVTPWPNVLYAFDLTQEGYPLRWKYRPDVSANAIGVSCCDTVNRGAFYADGKIVYNLLDGHTVAVEASSGRELWSTQIADVSNGETVTMAPLVVRDRVIVGASGGEFGIYGWVKGLDLKSGRTVWTAHNIGPDKDMLARAGTFKPPYDSGVDLGARSWANDSWHTGGAPVWGSISYDPQLDLIYYGTGNASPYNPEQRLGDDKWSASVLARKPEDGTLVWAYQFTPHDNWDYDATGAMILADLTVDGKRIRALVHFDKNGFAYTLDRATGRLLLAVPFAPVTWAKSVDLATGRPLLDTAKQTGASRGNVKGICPSLEGGVSPSSPAAYSPRTHLFYTSTNNLCMDYAATRASRLKGTPFMGVTSPYFAGPGGNLGTFMAWDAASGRKVWENKEPYPNWSGALVTAGDVAFYGTLDGWFKSVDARTGKVLSKFKVGSGVVGNPITYRGPDGKQYVAVYAGFGGDWALLSGDVRSDDPADVRPPADFLKDIARHTSQGGIIWIFGL
ncbi:MAG: PQQ-dependent dehydrogenase, methanol/ethanol family [Gammaproteobacteria bacterium]|nr:MAG: PQQ-dependent dehydrogenase, methanol/ethanol family [Gammaproteobacteria bacterium]TLZ39933.1 MAG: PQQ-dependent dehydrogenase, methanol/ethanol family [Gammaproteobacteria bacterium]